MKGFINLIKPEGKSSAFAVGAVKYKFKTPCGHMGTLDPMASGVLPVGVGKTSRMFPFLLDKNKTYIARFQFGYMTDTLDKTGEVIETTENIPTEQQIRSVLNNFIGEIEQVPPKYSAKCVNGKRGYWLAKRGIDFELEPKKVKITKLELTQKTGENEYEFVIECGGGTYIRSIGRDLGFILSSLATMTKLERSQSGIFTTQNGVTLEEFKNSPNPEKYLIPAEDAVDYEKVVLTNEQATKILNGVFTKYPLKDGLYRVFNESEFWGIGEVIQGILKIKAYVR